MYLNIYMLSITKYIEILNWKIHMCFSSYHAPTLPHMSKNI